MILDEQEYREASERLEAERIRLDRHRQQHSMQIKFDDVMTIDELAAYVKVSKSTLYKLVQNGKVPGQKIGSSELGDEEFSGTDEELAHELSGEPA